MENITFEQLILAAVALLALLGAYKTVMDVVKIRREEKKLAAAPVEDLRDTVKRHGEMLDRDKRRLEKLEEAQDRQNDELTALRDGMNVLMRSTLAMTRHMRYGNNVDGLDEADRDITGYLTGKKE